MPQFLSKLYVHLVFSTKGRRALLRDDLRERLHEYMGGALNGMDSPPIEINSVADHTHLLFLMSRTKSISQIVGELKEDSCKWLKRTFDGLTSFYWQGGYADFSVSQSNVDSVREYIRNQQEHHRKISFQEELRALLAKHQIEYDERYVWD